MSNLLTVQSFKCMGSTIDRRGGASKDVESRVTKAWSKWRELGGEICDKKVPTKLKLLIDQAVIRPPSLYVCETSWPMSISSSFCQNNADDLFAQKKTAIDQIYQIMQFSNRGIIIHTRPYIAYCTICQ